MKRTMALSIRVSEREYAALNSIAQNEGVSISEATRLIIHDTCNQRGFSVGMVGVPSAEKKSTAEDGQQP
jgi:hypothetical protein